MQHVESFLEKRIESLISDQSVPINLETVAGRCRAVIEWREMIPEAVMAPEAECFRIYLQKNFADSPGGRLRQRFSLAHEISHILFYESRDGAMKPRRNSPKGDQLERACHKGARYLLVPKSLLKKELRGLAEVDTETITRLARRFNVSFEVMLRRLANVEAFGIRFSPVLTRSSKGHGFQVEFAEYPPWIRGCLLPKPMRGIQFEEWFYTGAENGNGEAAQSSSHELKRSTPHGLLVAKPVDITRTTRIYELRLV